LALGATGFNADYMARTTSAPAVAIFRAREDAEPSAARLSARGFSAIIAPVVELHGTDASPPDERFDFVLATSAKAFLFGSEAVLAAARGLPLYLVGEKTAAGARARGVSPVGDAAADVAELIPRLQGVSGHALYIAGRDRRPDLEAALAGRVTTLVVYEARARDGWSAEEARAVANASAAVHYSERGAALAARFAESAGIAAAFRYGPHVCLSRQVAGPLAAFGAARVLWPRTLREEAVFDTLESALADYGAK
jgi:uroporphyrinogen-III synthase